VTTSAAEQVSARSYRRLSIAFGVATLVLLAIVGWQGFSAAMAQPVVQNQVLDLLKRQETAWNNGDLDGFMSGYRMSDDITFFSDDQIRSGWVALRDRYDQRYRKEGRSMGKLSFDDLKVDVLAVDAAMVRGRWKLDLDGKTPHGLFTLLVRRFSDGWKIVHDHTSAAPEKKE
jgi:beta-aspartyl-peptidase (threonine type)